VLDLLAGETSPLYNRLLNDGLINTTFGYEYFCGYGYASLIFEGESKDPDAVADAIQAEILRVQKDGIDDAEFERALKMNYGKAIMDYNDIDGLANDMVAAHFEGWDMFDDIDIYRSLTKEDAEQYLREKIRMDRSAISVILPQGADS